MKKINDFVENASYWKVYLISVIFVAITVLGSFMLFGGEFRTHLMTIKLIKFALAFGSIFGFLVVLTVNLLRKSNSFWKLAETVGENIENANTKQELDFIRKNEFDDLINLCHGTPHLSELHRLFAILTTKNKFVK